MSFSLPTPGDISHLGQQTAADMQIFLATQQGQGWQAWTKPKGISMAFLMALAGGGGGGGGFTRTAGSAGGGGAGGACSGVARLMIPAQLLPDVLYVQVGQGGLGGAASANGTTGANSYISFGHSSVVPSVLLASGVNAPGGGGAGTGSAGGTGGTVPTIATTITSQVFGEWFATVGIVGGAGGVQTGAVGTTITAWAGLPLSPGAGGAGCTTTDYAGGQQTATAAVDFGCLNFVAAAGGLVLGGVAAGLLDGGAGITLWPPNTPFIACGGAGGASNNSGTAGNGGMGGIGCGGGGGGAGTTGGWGGNGGNGMVLIISW
jgi:hypothetical protein